MHNGLTVRQAKIIHQLLMERGITDYEIIGATPEGKDLPGSTYEGEIESVSGTVVTATTAYDFWLDWFEGNYTLGEHRGFWEEVNLDKTLDKDEIVASQQRLRHGHTVLATSTPTWGRCGRDPRVPAAPTRNISAVTAAIRTS